MIRRLYFNLLVVMLLLPSFVSVCAQQTKKNNKPKQHISKNLEAKSDEKYIFKIIKREANQEVNIGGVKIFDLPIFRFDDFVFTDSGDMFYYGYAKGGRAIFKNELPLAYPGKNFSGTTIYQEQSPYGGGVDYNRSPKLIAVSRGGDVLFEVNNIAQINGINYSFYSIVFNDKLIFDAEALSRKENDPNDHTDRITQPRVLGFTETNEYVIQVIHKKWVSVLDQEGKKILDNAGNPTFRFEENPKYLVNGVLVDAEPENIEKNLLPQSPVVKTGITPNFIMSKVFGRKIEAGLDDDISTYTRQTHYGQIRYNRKRQVALLLNSSAFDWPAQGPKVAQAIILATPKTVTPNPTLPQPGDIVVYRDQKSPGVFSPNYSHVAVIVEGGIKDNHDGTATIIKVRGKWGPYGVCSHDPDNSIYGKKWTVWRRKRKVNVADLLRRNELDIKRVDGKPYCFLTDKGREIYHTGPYNYALTLEDFKKYVDSNGLTGYILELEKPVDYYDCRGFVFGNKRACLAGTQKTWIFDQTNMILTDGYEQITTAMHSGGNAK